MKNTTKLSQHQASQASQPSILKGFLFAVLPAFLLATSVGQIYAFSNFVSGFVQATSAPLSHVQLAFSLGIFFLGMGAAFFGKLVEKNVSISATLGTVLFIIGFSLSAYSVSHNSLPLLLIGYGVILGLGTGIVYLTPVKTMMLWFPKYKAIAAAAPIIFFGLGSTFSTWLHGLLHTKMPLALELTTMLDYIYFPMMLLGCLLLKKPAYAVSTQEKSVTYEEVFKDRFFYQSWFFMFLNISSGLMIIPLTRQMLTNSTWLTVSQIGLVMGLAGVFNGVGRFFFAWLSDLFNNRSRVLIVICALSALALLGSIVTSSILAIAVLIINACYGAGFSVIPSIIHDHYGNEGLSMIHGAVLSAWGVAGLFGNQLSVFLERVGGWNTVLGCAVLFHCINLMNVILLKRIERSLSQKENK